MVAPIFGGFEFYVWVNMTASWQRITRKEYNRLKKKGRDVMYLRKERRDEE